MPKFVDEILSEVADLHELWCDADAMMPKDEIVSSVEFADLHELWCDADAMMREFYRCHLAGEAPSKEFLDEVNEYIESLAEEG